MRGERRRGVAVPIAGERLNLGVSRLFFRFCENHAGLTLTADEIIAATFSEAPS